MGDCQYHDMQYHDMQYQIFEHAFELLKSTLIQSISELVLCLSLPVAELHICASSNRSLTSNFLQINMLPACLAQPHTCGNVERVYK